MLQKNALLLDLGSYEIKGMFFDEKSNKILFETQKKTGMTNGYINNVFLFQTAVLTIIKNLEKQVNRKIVNVILLVSGKILEYKTLFVQNIHINGVIDQYKIERIDARIKKWVQDKNGILLKSYPVEYILDDYRVENPYGLYTDVLSFKYFICYSLRVKTNNLVYLLEQLNLNVIDIVPSIFALGDRYLTEDEKRLGSLILDIGHSKVHWSFYYKGVPIKAGNINIGSELITAKIARSLKISLDEASNIKHDYLSVALKPEHFCTWVRVIRESNEEFILQSEMIRKILPEITMFIEEIRKIIEIFVNQKGYNAILCGNAAYLTDLVEYLQKVNGILLKTIGKDDIVGISDNFFKQLKSEKSMHKLFKGIKSFFYYFFDN